MAYEEALADRIRDVLAARSGLNERKMFGGIAFMLDGNMACGVMATISWSALIQPTPSALLPRGRVAVAGALFPAIWMGKAPRL
jgi:hypothetical protein